MKNKQKLPGLPPANPRQPDKQNKFHPLHSQQLAWSRDNQFAVGIYFFFFFWEAVRRSLWEG